jgi:capsular exopolysaccharide synthesis family protein
MTEARQGTTPDYLRVLRNSRGLILAVTFAVAAIAAGLSLSQETKYIASARVSFQEENRTNAAAGLEAVQTQTAAQLAAAGASTMLSNDVLQRVRQRLQSRQTVVELRKLLTTTADPASALVTVAAETTDKEFAATLANEVAKGAVNVQKNEVRDRYERQAVRVERQYEQLRKEQTPGSREFALSALLDRIATLRTLSSNATPARLAESASVPTSPSSPKPIRSTLFGGLIGLMLGCGLAFLRDSLDRRLRDSHDIQKELDLPVVGSVRLEALGNVAYIANGLGPMTSQDVESFRIMRTNLEFLDIDNPVKSILVTSPLPEEGKSTVAASLATANAAAGKRTLLVECDLRRPVFSDRIAVQKGPGLSDYLAGQATPAEIVQVVTLTETADDDESKNGDVAVPSVAGQLAVIAAGSQSVRPAELIGSQRFRTFLEDVTEAYDTVVIDSPPLLSVSDTLEIVPLVDGVLICIRADQTTRDQARAVNTALARLPSRTTALVVTGLKPGRESDYGYYSYAYDYTTKRKTA